MFFRTAHQYTLEGETVHSHREPGQLHPWSQKTAPAKYAQLVYRKDNTGVGPLVKSLA